MVLTYRWAQIVFNGIDVQMGTDRIYGVQVSTDRIYGVQVATDRN